MKSEKKKIRIGDRATYFYIKNLKKWMFCPSCKNGKMSFNKKASHWVCEDCGYSFSEEYFLDDCVFWFCDECETYSICRKHIIHTTKYYLKKCTHFGESRYIASTQKLSDSILSDIYFCGVLNVAAFYFLSDRQEIAFSLSIT